MQPLCGCRDKFRIAVGVQPGVLTDQRTQDTVIITTVLWFCGKCRAVRDQTVRGSWTLGQIRGRPENVPALYAPAQIADPGDGMTCLSADEPGHAHTESCMIIPTELAQPRTVTVNGARPPRQRPQRPRPYSVPPELPERIVAPRQVLPRRDPRRPEDQFTLGRERRIAGTYPPSQNGFGRPDPSGM
jgi:hypothetical protein